MGLHLHHCCQASILHHCCLLLTQPRQKQFETRAELQLYIQRVSVLCNSSNADDWVSETRKMSSVAMVGDFIQSRVQETAVGQAAVLWLMLC